MTQKQGEPAQIAPSHHHGGPKMKSDMAEMVEDMSGLKKFQKQNA